MLPAWQIIPYIRIIFYKITLRCVVSGFLNLNSTYLSVEPSNYSIFCIFRAASKIFVGFVIIVVYDIATKIEWKQWVCIAFLLTDLTRIGTLQFVLQSCSSSEHGIQLFNVQWARLDKLSFLRWRYYYIFLAILKTFLASHSDLGFCKDEWFFIRLFWPVIWSNNFK